MKLVILAPEPPPFPSASSAAQKCSLGLISLSPCACCLVHHICQDIDEYIACGWEWGSGKEHGWREVEWVSTTQHKIRALSTGLALDTGSVLSPWGHSKPAAGATRLDTRCHCHPLQHLPGAQRGKELIIMIIIGWQVGWPNPGCTYACCLYVEAVKKIQMNLLKK